MRRLTVALCLLGLLGLRLGVHLSGEAAQAQIIPTLTVTPAPTTSSTATPGPTGGPAPSRTPAPSGPGVPTGPPRADLLVPELASDAFASPRMLLRWRGRGIDDGRVRSFLVQVRQLGLRRAADWRTLATGSSARGGTFTGAPGETYVVRVRARESDATGYGPPTTASVLVPLDERDRPVRLSPGWRKRHRSGAWKGTTAVASSPRATARLRFSKRRVRVIASRSPTAGSLAVRLDGLRTVVSLAGPEGRRQVAFDSGRLRRGRHRLTVSPAGGRVEIDAIAAG